MRRFRCVESRWIFRPVLCFVFFWIARALPGGNNVDRELQGNPDATTSQLLTIPLHMNCGSAIPYSTTSGKVWIADAGYHTEATVVTSIAASSILPTQASRDDPYIYQTVRETNEDELSYHLPVSNGDYTMVFHFIDGRRDSDEFPPTSLIFDLLLQGKLAVRDMDVTSLAGGRRRPYLLRRRMLVDNGMGIHFQLLQVQGKPSIAAIEVVQRKPFVGAPVAPVAPPYTQQPVSNIGKLGETTDRPAPLQILTLSPTGVPTRYPTAEPRSTPTRAPEVTLEPTTTPVTSKPSTSISQRPSDPLFEGGPSPTLSPVIGSFEPLRINVGGRAYIDPRTGNLWIRDKYFVGGSVYARYADIADTHQDVLYTTERFGNANFQYQIPLPIANYEVIFYFAETHFTAPGTRVFDIRVQQDLVFPAVDLIQLGGGQGNTAITLEVVAVVSDGLLSISLESLGAGHPKLNALEIILVEPHLAHAVAQGPYLAVDTDGDGFGLVELDGTLSHTHGINLVLTEWEWTIDNQMVASDEVASLRLPVGSHMVTLTVRDSGGNENSESTAIDVLAQGHPWISSVHPSRGTIAGGDVVTLTGFGFGSAARVQFGPVSVSTIVVENVNTIRVVAPLASLAAPVQIQVETPVGMSNAVTYTYEDGLPIVFEKGRIQSIPSPTTVAFGPDHKLYVGTSRGMLLKLTLDKNWRVTESVSSSIIANLGEQRMILGIAFDPTDVFSENPSVYISHSRPFHQSPRSSNAAATNGKVSRISGANLGTTFALQCVRSPPCKPYQCSFDCRCHRGYYHRIASFGP